MENSNIFQDSFLCTVLLVACLACPANFIYGRVEANVLSHMTFMPMLLRLVINFLGQVIRNASEGKYNTVNKSSSGKVTFQKCLNSGITLFSSKNIHKHSPLGHIRGYMKLGHAAYWALGTRVMCGSSPLFVAR